LAEVNSANCGQWQLFWREADFDAQTKHLERTQRATDKVFNGLAGGRRGEIDYKKI
jgi:hypothetical protein